MSQQISLTAICFPTCKNEGDCKSPDTCECSTGFGGPTCSDGKHLVAELA
jgi:hypothetical protein